MSNGCVLGITCNKPIRVSSPITFKSQLRSDGPRALFLYFRHPSISDEKNCRAGGNNMRPCPTVKSSSTVFSVQQQQRAVSAAEEFCIQIHKAPAKVITMNVSGGNSKEIFELFTNKLVFSVSVLQR